MLTLVSGGSASGKSEFAESLVVNSGCENRWYLATMLPYDEECHRRIARHRQMRAKKGFETLEVPYALQQLELTEPMQSGCALLECMSNLVANEVFAPEGRGADCSEVLKCGLHHLAGTAAHLVIVTNDIFSDGVTYDPETEQYRKILGEVNREAAAMADYVYEVVCGIPICVKGEKRDVTDKNDKNNR